MRWCCVKVLLSNAHIPKEIFGSSDYYTCTARIISVGDPRIVTDVIGTHLAGYNYLNVSGMLIENQVLSLAPLNIPTFLPNIELYRILNAQTEEIQPRDIAGFKRLRFYMVNTSQSLISVPPNMFANHPQLEGIAVNQNRMQHVAYNVFDNLNQLHSLWIGSTCIDYGVNRNRASILTNLFNIYRSCPPTLQMLNEQLNRRCCRN